jgi:REP element-mobilizing transposase RayT
MGADAKPCSSAVKIGSNADCHGDAETFDQIDRTAIFKVDTDREDFLNRLSSLLLESQTPCYAWVLMSNHAHLLLRIGGQSIASIMRGF